MCPVGSTRGVAQGSYFRMLVLVEKSWGDNGFILSGQQHFMAKHPTEVCTNRDIASVAMSHLVYVITIQPCYVKAKKMCYWTKGC